MTNSDNGFCDHCCTLQDRILGALFPQLSSLRRLDLTLDFVTSRYCFRPYVSSNLLNEFRRRVDAAAPSGLEVTIKHAPYQEPVWPRLHPTLSSFGQFDVSDEIDAWDDWVRAIVGFEHICNELTPPDPSRTSTWIGPCRRCMTEVTTQISTQTAGGGGQIRTLQEDVRGGAGVARSGSQNSKAIRCAEFLRASLRMRKVDSATHVRPIQAMRQKPLA